MKLVINDLYTHFVFITSEKEPYISEKIREPLENHLTKVVNHNSCQMLAVYANPEHVHFLISRSPRLSEETIATIVAQTSCRFINNKLFSNGNFSWHHT
ncbi:MAG: transposase, partial [Mariniphaga sp.]